MKLILPILTALAVAAACSTSAGPSDEDGSRLWLPAQDSLRTPGSVRCNVNASPKHLGSLDTSDPLDPKVRQWWKETIDQIYYMIPDFGGLGFDRTTSGSSNVECYASPSRQQYEDITACPENLLLWFHHVPWNYRTRDWNTLWNELCFKYQEGLDSVRAAPAMQDLKLSNKHRENRNYGKRIFPRYRQDTFRMTSVQEPYGLPLL